MDGYQVGYTVITNIDDMIQMQKEQSVTYDNLPGFVAKYRIDQELNMILLESNSRFAEYFGSEAERGENSVYQRNIRDNKEAIWGQKRKHSGRKASAFYHVCKKQGGAEAWAGR